jgi:hypothetical protein
MSVFLVWLLDGLNYLSILNRLNSFESAWSVFDPILLPATGDQIQVVFWW